MADQGNQNDNGTPEMRVESETAEFKSPRPPPPYSPLAPLPQVNSSTGPTATVVQSTVIVQQPQLRSSPMFFTCPMCKTKIVTRVNHINTGRTHLVAGLICGFTCWCLLCCLAAIPYMFPAFKKSEHFCPNCKTYLGSYSMV